MAKVVPKNTSQDEKDDDLQILHPDMDIKINGEALTVREYGFVEGLRLRPLTKPILEAFTVLFDSGEEITVDHVLGLLADHYETALQLVAASIDRDMAWMEDLNDKDGQELLMVWWAVNGPFFVRSVKRAKLAQALTRSRQSDPESAGVTSTPP
ncbi:MAG: DUF6631 family protein [Alcanivorax jadensis]|uniref:DUF6631 family protein n=1 Tax=Alcanivorax jadensis TaxID=64988 RepID=UPI0030014DAC